MVVWQSRTRPGPCSAWMTSSSSWPSRPSRGPQVATGHPYDTTATAGCRCATAPARSPPCSPPRSSSGWSRPGRRFESRFTARLRRGDRARDAAPPAGRGDGPPGRRSWTGRSGWSRRRWPGSGGPPPGTRRRTERRHGEGHARGLVHDHPTQPVIKPHSVSVGGAGHTWEPSGETSSSAGPAVHHALARWAADGARSTNAEIEVVLRPRSPPPDDCRPGRAAARPGAAQAGR